MPNSDWFVHDRFGLFIHWGIYAMPARHEWVKMRELISDEDYLNYFDYFCDALNRLFYQVKFQLLILILELLTLILQYVFCRSSIYKALIQRKQTQFKSTINQTHNYQLVINLKSAS